MKSGSMRYFGLTVLLSALCLVLVSIAWKSPILLAIFLAANAGMLIFAGKKPKADLLLFVLSAILGACAEIAGIYAGAWSYPLPDFFGIPYWLPLVWGTAGIFLVRLSEWIGEYLGIRAPAN